MSDFFRPGDAPDPIYRNLRDGNEAHYARGRDYIERLWRQGAPYLDTGAADKARHQFVSVFWELQLVHALKSSGKNLVPRQRLAYRNNKGPDLFVEGEAGTWIEAVAVTSGTGPDAVRCPEMEKVSSRNPDAVVLRLCSVISDKSSKLRGYLDAGIIKPGQATVIAISSVSLPDRISGIPPPEIVRSVYPVGNLAFQLDRATGAVDGRHLEFRDRVKKNLGSEVATDVFLNPEFSHVSAVLFDDVDYVTPVIPPSADFKLVHNSLAATPLPDGWLPTCDEYWWRDGGQIEHVRRG